MNRVVLAHLNITSLRNKLYLLAAQIKGNADVLALLETKLDDSFPAGQSKITIYASPFRVDQNQNQYGNNILIGDFNVSIDDPHMKSFCEFCEPHRLKSRIKDPACFKNPENPSCIDLILTNSPYSFQNSCVIENGLSDFHRIIVSVMKTTFQKLKPRFNIETILNFLIIILGKNFRKIYL